MPIKSALRKSLPGSTKLIKIRTRFSITMKCFIEGYYRFLKRLLTVLMGLIIVPVTLQIISRYTGFIPRYIWTEEAARFCFVWIIMIGAMIAVKEDTHFDVDILPHAKTKQSQGIRNLIVHLSIGIMGGFFCYYGFKFTQFGMIQNSEMSGINMATINISFPIAGLTWLIFLVEKFMDDFKLIRQPYEAEATG